MSTLNSTAPMFSYAQAAKGLAPTAQVSLSTTSSTSSEQSNRDAPSTADVPAHQTKSRTPSNSMDTSSAKQLPNGSPPVDRVEEKDKLRIDSKDSIQHAQKSDTNALVDANPALAIADDFSSSKIPNGTFGVDGENKVVDQDLEKSIYSDDQEKGRDLDDDWEKVSVPSVTAEKELKAAPIPAVNIWQQRKELQEAKMKETVGQRQVPAAPIPKQKSQTPPARDDSKRKSGSKDAGPDKDTSAQRRNNSGIRPGTLERKEQSPSQLSPRSLSKQGEKNGSGFPATGDAESWPTPENAVVDERRRSAAHEKAEKGDAKATSQKKWIQMPFVPTAKFETQLPPAAAARRGGRASNRGRESSHRGSHTTSAAQAGEKSEVGSMGPPPPPKQTAEQDRGRKGETSRSQRASSVPTSTGRPTSNEDQAPNFRKTSAVPQRGQVEPNKVTASSQRAPHTTADESSVTDSSRSPSRQPTRGSAPNRKQEVDVVQAASSQAAPEPSFRNPTNTERNRGNSRDEFRVSTEFNDRPLPVGREWSRGRPESTREKADSWKERREPRGERGRGGGYRGRGAHSNYGSHSQTYTAPLLQNGFEPSKYPTEGRNRQASQPFSQTQSIQGARSNPRSQSIPVSVTASSFFTPISGFQQAMSPVQGDLNYSNYPGQMPSGIMNAMPYADQLNSMALISMVITQVEYYFSINNLCKDVFLRKNMDSQGFVPLNVIAGFKRIQALTDGQMSHEQFRTVCQQAPHIEFVTSDNGEDKLRARNGWKDFILPVEERLPSAQNDGPSLRLQQRHQSNHAQNIAGPGLPIRSPTAMNGFTEPFTPSMQGMSYPPVSPFDGSIPDSYSMRPDASQVEQARRSSATSPFGHAQSPPMQESGRTSSYMSNGHHRSGSNITSTQNVFPDEKISELTVVLRDTTFEPNHPHPKNTADPKSPKLRGGAGSHQQLENFKNIQFGQTSPDTEEEMPFWTKHGHIAKVPEGPSYIHEDYLSLRHKAVAQRDDKHFDGALAVLYTFWSSFLVKNFNTSMYQEFANFAEEEAAAGSQNGQQHLLSFYEALLKRKVPISERIASDIVSLFHKERERGDKGPVFETLRTALRNGATDFKTVKRITDSLTAEEKAELGV